MEVKDMELRKLLFPILVLVLLLAGMAGCASTTARPIELVPQDANFVANVQLSQIINDQDFKNAYDQAKKPLDQPQTLDEALDKVVQESGIDLRDFSEGLIFGDVTNLERGDYIGVIVEGSFNEATFVGNIEARAKEKFTTSDYKGYKVYTGDNGKVALVFLSDRMLLLGSPRAVNDVIDASKGERSRLSGQVLETYDGLGAGLIKAAFKIPESARRGLGEKPAVGLPFSLKPFADTDLVGFALSKEAEAITLRIDAHFVSTTSAQDAKDTVSGAISLLKGMSQEPEVKELLGAIQVTVSESSLSIALKTTLSQLEKLTESFQE
jgi:hypothetical protein